MTSKPSSQREANLEASSSAKPKRLLRRRKKAVPAVADHPIESTPPPTPVSRIKKIFRRLTRRPERMRDFDRQLLFSLRSTKWPSLSQFRHSRRVLSKTERRVVAACFAVIGVTVLWVGIQSVAARLVSLPVSGGVYAEALVGQPRFINPLLASSSAVDTDISRLVHAGLLRYDANLTLTPDLAESYGVSDDGKSYLFVLRSDIHWHDGEPITVDDVVFTFQSVSQKELDSPLAPNFSGVVVEKVDDRTIRFTLRDAYPAFPHLLTTGILPKHVWGTIETKSWRTADINLRPVGAGPWQFDSISRERDGSVKQYSLTRAPARLGTLTPYLDQLVFKFYPDETTAEDALSSHAVQGLALISHRERQPSAFSRRLATYDLPLPATTSVFFNLNVPSPVQDVKVRQALRAAIDVPQLVKEVLGDDAQVASGPFPLSLIATDPVTFPTDAETLLTEAGWTRVGALWKKSESTLSLNLSVIDREPDRSIGEAIVQRWQALGVDTRIDLISPAEPTHIQSSTLRPRSYQALLYTVVYGALPDPYPFWHSSQRVDPGLNLSLFSNKDVDDAIEQARRSTDSAVRTKSLNQISKIIQEEAVGIFLFTPIRHYVVSEEIHGVHIGNIATPADRFNALSAWYTKVREALR